MMLFKISLANIKKSFKDYAIYFFTLILGVAIFYVFNAIDSQTALLNVASNTADIIKLMTNLLSGVSVFVSIILGFLIIYASRFLIKRRNKEFGIYLTLGMSKRKISMILFFETLIIGILSLIVGLGLGVIASQFMSILVAKMFEADMTKFVFTFSKDACVKTIIYFAIMYLFVMIFNTFSISKCKLIDLLHGDKKSEKIKMKNPVICTIIFIVAICILGYAYYMVGDGLNRINSDKDVFVAIGLGSVSTFLIFWSLSGLLINIFTKMKHTYYKGLNSFTLRQFSSKINTTVFSTTIICLMLFITICVLSSALYVKSSLNENLTTLLPMDVELTKYWNHDNGNEVIYEDSKYNIITTLENNGFDMNTLKDVVEFDIYHKENLTLNNTIGSKLNEIKNEYPFLKYDSVEDIMTISDYNKVARAFGNETYSLSDNEYMIVADYDSMVKIRNKALQNNEKITINDKEYAPKYEECKYGFVVLTSNHVTTGIIIVPDNAVNSDMLYENNIVANYNATTDDDKQLVEDNLQKISSETWNKTSLISISSKIDVTNNSVGLGALVTFIALYLGIIFLISSAALLALKELSESTDNRVRYMMIRKLGADESLINRTLFKQIGIFFMFPLLIAIIHSIFGINFCISILSTFGNFEMLSSIFATAGFIVFIYGGYFLLTYLCSKNIIKER